MSTDPAGHWAPERIERAELRYYPDHIARYRFALQWAPGADILDAPCGTGYGTVLLGAASARSVVGIDLAEEAIAAANADWRPPNTRFEQMDAMQLPFRDEFDLAVCLEGLEHVPDGPRLVDGLARALRQTGVLIISTPNSASMEGGHSGNPFHVREYTATEFRELLTPRFAEVRLYYQRRNDPLDEPWSAGRAIKSLVPAALRRALRSRPNPPAQAAAPAEPEARAWLAADTRDRYYPRSWNYLGFPGMEPGFQPDVIMAVCLRPRVR